MNFFQGSIFAKDKDGIERLAKKESASVLLVSDSHGRKDVFVSIIERFGADRDALVFCGDGMGDLFSVLTNAKKRKSFAACLPSVVAFARGNGDYSFFPFYDVEVKIPLHQNFKIAGMNILISHGHIESVYYGIERLVQSAAENQADIVFYGHTHIAAREERDLTYFINPGSCSRPRGGQPPSFAIVNVPGGQERAETTFFSIRNELDSINFVPYVPVPASFF